LTELNWLEHTRMLPKGPQLKGYDHLMKQKWFAMFSDPGTGKTKLCFDIFCTKATLDEVDTLIVFAYPSEVHIQWVVEQFEKHWWTNLKERRNAWDGKKLPDWALKAPKEGEKHILTFNIESLRSKKVFEPLLDLVKRRGDRIMFVIDESQTIKNKESKSWFRANSLGKFCENKGIMTGTPIAKSLVDEWSQFCFLSEDIIGIEYKTAFQAQFCVMGGRDGREFIGARQLDVFNRLIAPYTFRATRQEFGIPDAMPPDELVFNLTPEQRTAQESLRETFLLEYDRLANNFGTDVPVGELLTISNIGVLFLKLQQIGGGYIVGNDKELHWLKENPRIEAFDQFQAIQDDKLVVWCRFRPDIELLKKRYGDKAVTYYGGNTREEKQAAKKAFINDDKVRLFIANPASAGTGTDGLQYVCRKGIYYSHTFNSILRTQSEMRTCRLGSTEVGLYLDIIARAGIDRFVINNVKGKRSFADLALGDLKNAIEELET